MPSDLKSRSRLVATIRASLFEIYGPDCAECGRTLTNTAWEVNHIWQRDWTPRKLDFYRRHLRYFREAQKGWINLLCSDCNNTYRPRPAEQRPTNQTCTRFAAWLEGRSPATAQQPLTSNEPF